MGEEHKMVEEVMALREGFQPLIDAANGMRKQMVSEGWPEDEAGRVASTWLNGAIQMIWAKSLAQMMEEARGNTGLFG